MQGILATDRRFAIVGLGKTGLSCARFMASRGHAFAGFDSNATATGAEAFRRTWPSAPLYTGSFDAAELSRFTDIVVSPGIRTDEPAVVAAVDAGARLTSDIELFCEATSLPVLAITGSNGKSTVTTLVGRMALRAGIAAGVGGNLGPPALDLLVDNHKELFVLELSSFQLERLDALGARVAALLNVSPDHMDRYRDITAYHAAKHRIFRGCDVAVFNRDDRLTQPLLPASVQTVTFGLGRPDLGHFGIAAGDGDEYLARGHELLMATTEVRLPGRHNLANALAALAIGDAAGLPMPVMLDELRRFTGLAHRCELVAEVDGVRFIDDSKGTNVGATVAAVKGLTAGGADIVLIAGGIGKGQDFAVLKTVQPHVKAWVLIGEAADTIAAVLDESTECIRAQSMSEAVAAAAALAGRGDTVLLSPACASFDMFDDYIDRGGRFAAAVRAGGDR